MRDEDVSGVSALGNDAEIVKSSSGKAVVAWRMPKVTIDVQDTLEIVGRM